MATRSIVRFGDSGWSLRWRLFATICAVAVPALAIMSLWAFRENATLGASRAAARERVTSLAVTRVETLLRANWLAGSAIRNGLGDTPLSAASCATFSGPNANFA